MFTYFSLQSTPAARITEAVAAFRAKYALPDATPLVVQVPGGEEATTLPGARCLPAPGNWPLRGGYYRVAIESEVFV